MIYKGLPGYYRKSELTAAAHTAAQKALNDFEQKTDRKMLDLFIVETEDFTRHEKDAGLIVNDTLDDETRRAKVLTRLRGSEVLTVEALKELVKLYEPGGANVTEIYSDYTVMVDFLSHTGAPENIVEIINAIYEVIPAHLALRYGMKKDLKTKTLYFAGGIHISRRMSIPIQQRASYGDIKNKLYGTVKGRPYANILQSKEG